MKITVDRSELKRALMRLGRMLPKGSADALKSVRISADQDVTLMTTNLETQMIVKVNKAEITDSGMEIVSFSPFKGIVNALKGINIDLEKNGDNLHINGHSLSVVDADDFPRPQVEKGGLDSFSLLGESLKKYLEVLSISYEKHGKRRDGIIRLKFTGLFIGNSQMVTSDGFRLTIVDDDELPDWNIIVPFLPLEHLRKGIMKNNFRDEFIFSFDSELKIVYIKNPTDKYVIKIIDEKYSSYQCVIPENSDFSLRINTQELLNNCEIASSLSDSDFYKCIVSYNDWSIDKVTSSIIGSDIINDKIGFWFLLEREFLLQVLKSYSKAGMKILTVKKETGFCPIVFGAENIKHVLMPMKLNKKTGKAILLTTTMEEEGVGELGTLLIYTSSEDAIEWVLNECSEFGDILHAEEDKLTMRVYSDYNIYEVKEYIESYNNKEI